MAQLFSLGHIYMPAHFAFLSAAVVYAGEVPDWVGYVILAAAVAGVALLGLLFFLLLRKKK